MLMDFINLDIAYHIGIEFKKKLPSIFDLPETLLPQYCENAHIIYRLYIFSGLNFHKLILSKKLCTIIFDRIVVYIM